MAKSAAPSGLSISRKNASFTCKWKQPTKKYGNGQDFQYQTNSKTWKSVSIGKTTTSKALSIPTSGFYPNAGKKKVSTIKFRVRGNTAKYTKNNKPVNPTMSAWSTKSMPIKAPKAPKLTKEIETWPEVKFSWKVATSASDKYWFTRVQYTSVLVMDSSVKDGAKIDWSTTVDGSTRYDSTSPSSDSYLPVLDDSDMLADGHSYTRWFRCRSQGPAGASAWKYSKHVYAMPNQCTITKHDVTASQSVSGYNVKVWFDSPFAEDRPLAEAIVEYAIDTPDADMECPDGASWTEGAKIKAKDGTSGAIFSIDSLIGLDQCLFVRVNANYDERTTYGTPEVVDVGKLTAPTITNVTTDSATHKATITATNNSSVPDSFMVVRYMDDEDPDGFDIAIIPHGQTQAVGVQCPEWTNTPKFGVYAAAPAGCYEVTTRDDGVGSYAVSPTMSSDMDTEGGIIPEAPATVTATPVMPSGTIRVTWKWSWADADTAELSWADHADAWESTNEPQTYDVSRMYASAWNISGLETGKKWYIRVRLIKSTAEGRAYGAYSDTMTVDLSSAPLVPVLTLSEGIIPPGGQVTANWVYSTTDGTAQSFAEITQVVDSGESDSDGDGGFVYIPIAQVQTAQYVTLDADELGWEAGDSIDLVVRVTSASGQDSDGWSDPRTVIVAEPPTCTITVTSLDTVTVTTTDEEGDPVTDTVTALTEMPFTCTVTGAGDSGVTAIAIERLAAYHVERPDETDYNGFEGETVAVDSHVGEDGFTVELTDLIGHLDDGAWYTLVATVTDGMGQSASASIDFEVLWDHQASAPEATVTIDNEYLIAVLTPTAPLDADPTDVCDIYRLSIDRPQLVYEGAEFGTTYVDPYPAIGEYGGYRFVTRTENGDVTTPDGSFAWLDTDDSLTTRYNIFEFDDGQVMLDLDVDISNQWRKDFKETQYLGGSVQGDWNKAVSRTATVSGTAIPGRDDDVIESVRRLADNAGICHVRTKDGSSYAADVQVSEKYNYASGLKTYEYTMAITRVEPEELDGMTLTEWQNVHEESE